MKGVSYAELSRATNEPERQVCFELDGDAVEVLQTLPGYRDFDPDTEVLEMLKPGTGCKDAPRCWAIQLTKVTNDKFGCVPTTHDEQLIVRHRAPQRQLDYIGSKHVDDLSVCTQAKTESKLSLATNDFEKENIRFGIFL